MKGLQADLPYPSLEGIGEDERSVRIISPAYADRGSEMTAVLQYVFQSVVFDGLGMQKYAETLLQIAIAEMDHLKILGTLLNQMGALPVFVSRPPVKFDFYTTHAVSYSREPTRMILDDISGETEAIRTYEGMVQKLQNDKVSEIIRRIILDERLHLKTLKELLEKLC